MVRLSIAAFLLVTLAANSASGQSEYTEADTIIAGVLVTTNLVTTVVNVLNVSKVNAGEWAIPVGLISGAVSLGWGAGKSLPMLMLTGVISGVFAVSHLVQSNEQEKAARPGQAQGRLRLEPVSIFAADGRCYGGVRASLSF
jgi:hypothetical protein